MDLCFHLNSVVRLQVPIDRRISYPLASNLYRVRDPLCAWVVAHGRHSVGLHCSPLPASAKYGQLPRPDGTALHCSLLGVK